MLAGCVGSIDVHKRCLCKYLLHTQMSSNAKRTLIGIDGVDMEMGERNGHGDERSLLLVKFVQGLCQPVRNRTRVACTVALIQMGHIFIAEVRVINEANSGVHRAWRESHGDDRKMGSPARLPNEARF